MVGSPRGGAWGSALSVAEFAALRGVGFEPAGQVFGAAVYPLNVIGPVGCPGVGARPNRHGNPPQDAGSAATIVSGSGIPGPVARVARALHDGRRTVLDRMTAACANVGGHGVVAASVRVREVTTETTSADVVEFTVVGTAVRAPGCPPLDRPFTCDLSGQEFARLVVAGWVPAGIALGVSVAAQHDHVPMTDRSRWGQANIEIPTYTDLIVQARQDARDQLERQVRALGADGAVVSAMTVHRDSEVCHAHPGGIDHVAQAVIMATAIVRFADHAAGAAMPTMAVLRISEQSAETRDDH
jgi:uncharacterized protein YbjQ (UPF0145 family)